MFRSGDQIGPYTLINRIGRGGFGEVWLAERRAKFVTTKVAVKLPLEEQIDHEAIKHEATLWEQASGHPNILPIIDADEYDGQVVIVSEYAPDGSLEQWLKTHGKMSVEKAVETTIQILDGLEFLHSRKIIHRDLKPANILLQGKTPRLADFGISRALRTTMASQSKNISGTFAYMSPEALDGRRSVQTDIWSVGVNLYEFLNATLPFPQKEPSQLFPAIVMRDPQPLSDFVPTELRQIVAKALSKLPENRYKTCTEMKNDLELFLKRFSNTPIESPGDTAPNNVNPDKSGSDSVVTRVKKVPERDKTATKIKLAPDMFSIPEDRGNAGKYFGISVILLALLILIGAGVWLVGNSSMLNELSVESAREQDIAAMVNGVPVKLEDVEKTIKNQMQGQVLTLSRAELGQKRLDTVNDLIEEEVLFQKAQKEGVIPTDKMIQDEINKVKVQSGKSAEEFEKMLGEMGETQVSFKNKIKRQLAVNRVFEKITGYVIPPTESEIREFFSKNKNDLQKKYGKDATSDRLDVYGAITEILVDQRKKLAISQFQTAAMSEAKIVNYVAKYEINQ